ncbi:cytochrome d ubiquinol oxidase subunit II [Dysgonomonas sp. Marseille-P4677]|uniref:cytochrome d ubiquinol oxidase subunit II n=1 Tax=Dysgonomonas sp. Marseille-P4677 TaxID=2364790 RepID=UPI001911E7E2|nr:cytochrome d ubiquinol oxidase subunit II [Dysgonomonas sp. Marseille-P4677]MBK5722839.1 cytochrome d ubiquinol oxidase subunit II [Dysgonomonas sp. Marseille-P4677]
MDYSFLQHYWWFLICLIGGIFAFLLFVQGGQSMLFSLAKDEKERMILVNALGRKWEYTFTTLVTFGGALFASFPLFYSTSFGGAYWVWMAILFCFVLQAVSFEFQSKPGNVYGRNTYRWFLFINGLLGTFLVGAALATFFTGSDFTVNKENMTDIINPVISRWGTEWHGLEALANPRNWMLGLAVFFLARTLACLFFINRLADQNLVERSRKFLLYNSVPFVVFFLAFVIWTFIADGFAVNPDTKVVTMEAHKYFNNLVEMPIVGVVFLVGVVLVLFGIGKSLLSKDYSKGVWFSGIGTVLTVCMLLLITGYNNTAYYPSATDLQSSLTIQNSSSSEFTLTVMSVVSILVPFVLAYIIYAWNSLEKKRFDAKDLKDDGHVY